MTLGGNAGTAGVQAKRVRGAWVAALMMTSGLISAGIAAPAFAQDAQRSFDIPAQSLPDALTAFGQQSGLQVSAKAPLLEGRTSSAVKGALPSLQALSQLLSGTGLSFRVVGSTVTLEAAPQASSDAIRLGPVRVESAQASAHVTINDLTTTEGTQSYTTREVSFGKGPSLKETPQSVTVMTRQRIDDQALRTIEEVLDQTVGITLNRTDTVSTTFQARGFAINNVQIDGNSPIEAGTSISRLDMAIYDHVEVLRGADALYGNSGEAGGAINLVRKRPTADLQTKGSLAAGSWNNFRAEADISGPVAFDGKLRARIVGAYQQQDYFYDVAKSDREVIYGIVEADVTDSTRLTAGGSYIREWASYMRYGLPRYSDGRDLGLPRSFFLGSPDDRYVNRNLSLFARIDQKIGDDWSLGVEFSRLRVKGTRENLDWFGAVDPVTNGGVSSDGGLYYDYLNTQKAVDVVLKGKVSFFGREHQLILGANLNDRSQPASGYSRVNPMVIPDIFTYDPHDYAGYTQPYNKFFDTPWSVVQKGIYGSATIAVAKPVKLILGGRINWYKYDYRSINYDTVTGAETSRSRTLYRDDALFTPYAGLVVTITPEWTAYGSVAETYMSQASQLKAPLPGTPLDPVRGRNYELGVKGALADGRLTVALAAYHIRRRGGSVRDPEFPATPGQFGSNCCFLDDGRITSRGIDAEITGEVLPDWNISIGYTYNDNENKQANSGRYSTVTPKHLLKVWSSYQLPAALSDFKIGGGFTAQSSSYVKGTARTFNPDSGNYDGPSVPFEFTEPGRFVANAMIEYRIDGNWTAALNVNNLTDKKYYQTVGLSSYGNWYGEPRSFLLTVRGSY